MIIWKEKATPQERLVEMAKMKPSDIPSSVLNRVRGRPIDEWWWDRLERGNVYKVALEYEMTFDATKQIQVKVDYGFIRKYRNVRQGKSTGTVSNPEFIFTALHIVSNVPGITGQWFRDDFSDLDFEKIIQTEDKLAFTIDAVKKFIKDFKLKPAGNSSNMNILSILDRLL